MRNIFTSSKKMEAKKELMQRMLDETAQRRADFDKISMDRCRVVMFLNVEFRKDYRRYLSM